MMKILATISILVLFWTSCNIYKAQKVNFYLPNSFSGIGVVMYGCKDGISSKIQAQSRQISFSNSRFVKLREEINFGKIDYVFFIENLNGEMIRLKEYQPFEKNIQDSIYVGRGTVISVSEFTAESKEKSTQYGFVFYIHRKGEVIPTTYNDKWINDTLLSQIKINNSNL